jgi:hypothetical protein
MKVLSGLRFVDLTVLLNVCFNLNRYNDMNKRTFLKNTAFAGLVGILSGDGIGQTVKKVPGAPLAELTGD